MCNHASSSSDEKLLQFWPGSEEVKVVSMAHLLIFYTSSSGHKRAINTLDITGLFYEEHHTYNIEFIALLNQKDLVCRGSNLIKI